MNKDVELKRLVEEVERVSDDSDLKSHLSKQRIGNTAFVTVKVNLDETP